MSVSVKYKGNEILAIPSSGDYHLNTEGKYLEDDIRIIAEAAPPGSAIIIDTLDSAGGTIREIITDSEIYLQDEKVINPSETKTTVTPDSGYTALQAVTVNAISSTYIGSAIATRSSDDLSASGAVVTVPSGYYGAQATKSVSTTTHLSPSISLNSTTGVVSASHTQGAGYVTAGTTSSTLNLSTESAKTITPSTSTQTAVEAGKYTTGAIKVAAMPSGTAGTPTATKGAVSNHSISITPSVTNSTGYITGGTKTGTAVSVSASELVSGTYTVDSAGTKNVINYASASVPSGTAGTPTANKGSVNDHSITITPSVTNTTGFITGSTKIGTAVNIKASDLVSGTLNITTNSSFDVTNYATASVNVASETYTLTKSGNSIILTGSNGTTSSVIDSDTTYSNATTSTAGLMSAADKTKFDNWGDVVGALSGSTAIANKSVPSDGNWINLGSFSVPAGTWFIKVLVRFASNATGVRTINISTSSASAADVVWNTAKQQAAATGYTYVHLETFLSPSSTTTYYVNADQTGSAALTAATRYGGIRIY